MHADVCGSSTSSNIARDLQTPDTGLTLAYALNDNMHNSQLEPAYACRQL